jgi:hypothetical protein
MNRITTPATPVRRPALAAALVLALLFAQWLGLAHRYVHALGSSQVASGVQTWAQADAGVEVSPGNGEPSSLAEVLLRLVGKHADGNECRLYDHACGGDMVYGALSGVAADVPGIVPLPGSDRSSTSAPTLAYRARAPPLG